MAETHKGSQISMCLALSWEPQSFYVKIDQDPFFLMAPFRQKHFGFTCKSIFLDQWGVVEMNGALQGLECQMLLSQNSASHVIAEDKLTN